MIDSLLIIILVITLATTIFFSWMLWGLIHSRVPFLSSQKKAIEKMIDLAEIKEGQIVYDLGCGRGNILFEAGKRKKARFIGYEIVRPLVWVAKIKKQLKEDDSVELHCKDFFEEDLRNADVIFCYLLPHALEEFYEKKWHNLKPGTKVISNGFAFRYLTPKKVESVGKTKVYLYEK